MAQLSACHIADQRVQVLLDRYGTELVGHCIDSLLDYSEARIRAAITELPDGDYRGEDMVDSDGTPGSDPVRVAVKISIRGDGMTVDFSDSDPQRMGAAGNAHRVNTVAATRVALKCILGPDVASNDGFYRPIEIVTRPGTVTHPLYPAPGTVWDNVGRAIIESIFFALAAVVPERVTAGDLRRRAGDGHRRRGPRQPRAVHPLHALRRGLGGAQRARRDQRDVPPAERRQLQHPLRGHRGEIPAAGRALRADPGLRRRRGPARWTRHPHGLPGPGRGRGRLGGILPLALRAPRLHGGKSGGRSTLVLEADGPDAFEQPLSGGVAVGPGALISHRVGGGGGFADPGERPTELVEDDVMDDVAEAAASDYGFGGIATDV